MECEKEVEEVGDGYVGKKQRKGEVNMTEQGEKNTEGSSPKVLNHPHSSPCSV
jgi:hypothetical protein